MLATILYHDNYKYTHRCTCTTLYCDVCTLYTSRSNQCKLWVSRTRTRRVGGQGYGGGGGVSAGNIQHWSSSNWTGRCLPAELRLWLGLRSSMAAHRSPRAPRPPSPRMCAGSLNIKGIAGSACVHSPPAPIGNIRSERAREFLESDRFKHSHRYATVYYRRITMQTLTQASTISRMQYHTEPFDRKASVFTGVIRWGVYIAYNISMR